MTKLAVYLKCYWCGRFVSYGDVHYFYPADSYLGFDPPDAVIECRRCHYVRTDGSVDGEE